MAAFDPAAFDSAAFDAGAALTPVDQGSAVCPLRISVVSIGPAMPLPLAVSVVSPLVFSSSLHAVRWSVAVRIGDVDFSQLTGAINISAGEDAARVASFSLIPASPTDIDWLEGKQVTIDVSLFEPTTSATYRLFTGVIEGRVYPAANRVIEVTCSDGWQERPKACTSADSVELLFGGLISPCRKLVKWSDDEPDPSGYFNNLLATMTGATAIDSNGLWRAIPWSIGAPAATFGGGEIFDGSLAPHWPNRVDLPSEITARLNFRYNRLHAVEVGLSWAAVDYTRFVVDGLPTLAKSAVLQALSGASGWLVKGTPTFVEPIPGGYLVYLPPNNTPVSYLVGAPEAALTAESFSAVLYHRWYQEVDISYSITIDMGGTSDRDDSISASLASSFSGSEWETAPTTETATSIYAANAPYQPTTPTGYEGLPLPHPPANSSLEWYPDITLAELAEAAHYVVAMALRKTAIGRRKRYVEFARPLDPRWEIGSVLGVDAYGVAAAGQVIYLQHDLDLDSGEIVSTFRLACPAGSGNVTGFTADIDPPADSVAYSVQGPVLSNHIGASTETLANPPEDSLAGYLCNVYPGSPEYDETAPVYQTQFRLVLPEISATVRDPATVEKPITATVSIASGSLAITF